MILTYTNYYNRQCIFEGELDHYIYQVSFIYMTLIKNTIKTFQTCFPNVMMSAVVKWAKEHVEEYNSLLERQLSGVDPSSPEYKACLEYTLEHSALLREVGLDFKDIVGPGKRFDENGSIVSGNGAGLGIS
jgi:exocyst complex component 8